MKKRIIATVLATTMILSTLLTGCGNEASKETSESAPESAPEEGEEQEALGNTESDKVLHIWSFTDEVKVMIENYYLADHPDIDYKIEVTVIPSDSYETKLDSALATGKGGPDLFALNAPYVQKYTYSDLTMNVADLGISEEELSANLAYVNDAARDAEGNIKAISWQACPGGFFYRRSIAEEYLGTQDPDEVQAMISDFDSFLETAELLNTASNGEVKIIAGPKEIGQIYFANQESPWIVGDDFVISENIYEYMDTAKILQDNGYTSEIEGWTEGWFTGINQDNIFGYVLPTWGLHYVLKTNAEDKEAGTTTAGDWAVIQGPGSYFNGGTWLTVRNGSEMTEEAAELIRYITTDEKFLTQYAKDTGDVLANQTVADAIKGDFEEEFLGGQNHYEMFSDLAKEVTADTITGEDGAIQLLLNAQVDEYIRGNKDKETAIADFKANVKNAYPQLNVE
ncbi:MAG: ABC transporter substrate-binding protein [Eubacteriales bacterium]